MGIIKIKNLFLRSYVGFNPHEIGKKQDLVINITMHYNSSIEQESDDPKDALDYKLITKEIIGRVENSRFNLLETLTQMILNTVMEFSRVEMAEVEVDKVNALRYADSVSCTLIETRNNL